MIMGIQSSKKISSGLKFSQAVQAGSVWVNCYDHTIAHTPFGGTI